MRVGHACFRAPSSFVMLDRHAVASGSLQRGADSGNRTERRVFTSTIPRALFLNRLSTPSLNVLSVPAASTMLDHITDGQYPEDSPIYRVVETSG